MKNISFIILFFCAAISFGQMRSVSKKVQELKTENQQFQKFDLFTANNHAHRAAKYFTSATDVTVLDLNENQLERLVQEAPEYIEVSIPYQNEMVTVELFKHNIVTDSFTAKDESGNVLSFKLGQYYRGAIKGDYTSLVAMSFFEGDVMGVISSYEHGNIVVGKSTDRRDFVSYSDRNLLGNNPFVCGVEDLEDNIYSDGLEFQPEMLSAEMTDKCVKIYYEIARRPYQQNGSNIQNTINWITGIQNNIGTLYANDNINVALHEVKIWTTADPYTGNYSENLALFRDTVTEFSGDLAHLVNTPMTTSVAYLDSLCTGARYAYSGISMSYSQVPTYSWTIMAMTHEMGHSMGSQHTHACAWNGNNTQIDGCGPLSGNPDPNNGNCSAGPLPQNGGTIMSYCHLMSGVGINFLNGFGEQPGALIRSNIDSKPCLGSDCSCVSTIRGIEILQINGGQLSARILDDESTEWKYKVYPYGENPDATPWQTTTTNEFSVSGLLTEKYYEVLATNMCGESEGGQRRTIILTGDFCNGTLFTDTGGTTSVYGNNQTIVKTFYPATPSHKLSLSFSRIGLQNNRDFMYVYNGDSVSAPLFDGGTITGNNNPGPSFVSTHPSGAITIKFVSDGSGAVYGWEATVDCEAVLSIEDLTESKGIAVYPNPTTSVLNIEAQEEIVSVRLNDASGKRVVNKKSKTLREKLNIEHLPKGVYILTVELKGQTVTKKIIKN